MRQTRISLALSIRKAASCCNSLLHKFENGILYCLAFTSETPIQRFLRIDSYTYGWKPNTQFTSCCLGWLQAIIMLYLHLLSHMASDSTRRLTSTAWRRSCWPGSRGWLLEDLMSGNRSLRHTPPAEKSSLGRKKISVSRSPLTIWPPDLPHCNPLDVWGVVKRETDKTPSNTKDELKARITVTLTNLNTGIVGNARKGRNWNQWQFLWIHLIYCSSRYFHAISVSISNKVRCQWYFYLCVI